MDNEEKYFHEIIYFLHFVNNDVVGFIILHHLLHPIQQVVRIFELLVLPAFHIE